MTDLIDIAGLNELAIAFGMGAGELAVVNSAGSTELAKLSLWSDRSRFQALIETQEAWARRMADDLGVRAAGMARSEAAAQTRAMDNAIGDLYERIRLDAGRYGRTMPSQVRNALDQIETLLGTDGRDFLLFSIGDTDVSDQDLLGIMGILVGLSPAVLRGVFVSMDDVMLTKWLTEAEGSDVDPTLRRQMFSYIARVVGPSQLASLLFLSSGSIRSDLLQAMGTQSSEQTKGSVFDAVVDRIDERGDRRGLATSLLSGMDTRTREQALLRLETVGRLVPFVESLLGVEELLDVGYRNRTATVNYRYDASGLAELVSSLTRIDNADVKAAVFVSVVGVLEGPLAEASDLLQVAFGVTTTHRFVDGTGQAALAALAAMLTTDSLGVFDALRLDADVNGWATGDFFRELLREPGARPDRSGEPLSHDGAILANQILATLVGSDLDPEAKARFFQARDVSSGGLEDYVNAARVGYFAGALSRGLDDLGMSQDDQWTAVGIVLGGIGLVDPTKVTAVVEFLESTLEEISSEIRDRTVEQLRQEYVALEQMIIDQILPRDGRYIYDGDAADEFFNTYNRVGGLVTDR